MMNAQMTDPQAIKNFIFGGKAIITVRSVASGAHYTYKISEAKKRTNDLNEVPAYFVNLLTGPDNLADYTYIGMIFNRLSFGVTGKSKMAKDSPAVVAFEWSLRCILSNKIPGTLEIWHEGRCGRCARRLTVPESIATGFGPECAEMRVTLPLAPASAAEGWQPSKLITDFQKRLHERKQVAVETPSIIEQIEQVPTVPVHKDDLDAVLDDTEGRAVTQLKFKYESTRQ